MASRGFQDYASRKGYFSNFEPLHDTSVILHAKLIWKAHGRRVRDIGPSATNHEDYLLVADTIQRIITKLRKNRVEPIVIFQSHLASDVKVQLHIRTEKALVTHAESTRHRHHPLPLRQTVLFQTLENFNVEVLQADNHAYITMTHLANELGIPILTPYTDHLLHAIEPGVKYYKGSEIGHLFSPEDNDFVVSHWNYQTFVEREKITVEDLTLLSVADDTICKKNYQNYHMHYDFYERVLNLLRSLANEEMTSQQKLDFLIETLKLDKFREYAIGQYNVHTAENNEIEKVEQTRNQNNEVAPCDVENRSLAKYLRSASCHLRVGGKKAIPIPYQKAIRMGRFQSSLLSTFCKQKIFLPSLNEDAETTSVFSSSLPIRQYGYAIVLNYEGDSSMEEYARHGLDYIPTTVNVDNITDIALDEIPNLQLEERRNMLFDALMFNKTDRKEVRRHEQPLLKAIVLYWTLHCKPPQEYTDAIYYWTEYNFWRKHRDRNFHVPQIRETTTEELPKLHFPFTQLTAIVHDVLNLNEILLCPLPDFEINFQFSYLLQMAIAISIDNSDECFDVEVRSSDASLDWVGLDARSSEVSTTLDKPNFRGSTAGLFSGERYRRKSTENCADTPENPVTREPSRDRVPLWRRSMQKFETTNTRDGQRKDIVLDDGFELPAQARRRKERLERQVYQPQRSRRNSGKRLSSQPPK